MRRELNIWWKLAFVSAVLDVVVLAVLVSFSFGHCPEAIPIPFYVVFLAVLALPVAYTLVFCLWHWRTRYAGRHHLAWPILLVVTAWPLFSTYPGSIFVALAYCFLHLLPDARGRGDYASPAPVAVSPQASPLPKSYQLAKSTCFVLGWTMVIGGVLAATITCITNVIIWNAFETSLPQQIGKEFTESMSASLWCGSQIAKVTGLTCLLSALAAAVGAVLIQISQRLRWRLLDEQEKEELKQRI